MQRHCGNIGYTRHRAKTNKTEETIKNGQCRDTVATLGTQDTRRRQTKQKRQSRMDNAETLWQHWVHKTQDEDKQNKICVGHHHTQEKDKQTPNHNMCLKPLYVNKHK